MAAAAAKVERIESNIGHHSFFKKRRPRRTDRCLIPTIARDEPGDTKTQGFEPLEVGI